MKSSLFLSIVLGLVLIPVTSRGADSAVPKVLPGTAILEAEGDIASQLVAGVDAFLLRKLQQSVEKREQHWKRQYTSLGAYSRSIGPNRERLAHILGVRDPRVAAAEFELVAAVGEPSALGRGAGYEIYAVRWPAFRNVHGEGLLLRPKDKPVAFIIALPDADQTPEQIAGLAPGVAPESQFARRLAESGCEVLVPALISRQVEARNGRAKSTHREFLYRSAFELGRHIIGYEVQKVLAAVDHFENSHGDSIGVALFGWGEGGAISLYAAALDTRIDAVGVSGYVDDRRGVWRQPIDRNVFGLLEQFGDAELLSMVAPRAAVIEAAKGPELELPGEGGAPAILMTPDLEAVQSEVARAKEWIARLEPTPTLELIISDGGEGAYGTEETLQRLLREAAGNEARLANSGPAPVSLRSLPDPAARQRRQVAEIDRHNQWLLEESAYVRQEFMKKLDFSSPEKYEQSSAWYREFFADEVIGRFDDPLLEASPRTRLAYEHEKWTGYEVVLDVYPDVIAYGILLVPKGLAADEKHPVVVCQHGLEGRPRDLVQGDHRAYHDFAAKLAEQGFITFSPQNLYIFGDRFRTLQRKANPLKKTLFSVITPQHEQIIGWLKTLPYVDPKRIAFYGLSYGGKTAMRVPALLTDYCLSICSADFNEWVWKNASTRSPYSYVWTGEYEIFEFDLGSTFNYAEMAALIAPRPFMVERGHFDGVAPDEKVAHEFAKVRFLYQAKLGLFDRAAIEWFVGPHTINGKGTFDFLNKHLRSPAPDAEN